MPAARLVSYASPSSWGTDGRENIFACRYNQTVSHECFVQLKFQVPIRSRRRKTSQEAQ